MKTYYISYFLYRPMKVNIVATHKNRLTEAILIDDTMYSLTEKIKINRTNLHQNVFTIWSHVINAKIEMHQFVIFIKTQKFDTADSMGFTVQRMRGSSRNNFFYQRMF